MSERDRQTDGLTDGTAITVSLSA